VEAFLTDSIPTHIVKLVAHVAHSCVECIVAYLRASTTVIAQAQYVPSIIRGQAVHRSRIHFEVADSYACD